MRKVLVTCAALAVVLSASPPVGAVNGGLDGNAHPNVGVMLGLDDDGEIIEFCGGVLISPTAFLTNYNCPGAVDFVRSIGGRTVISFDPVFWPIRGGEVADRRGGVHPPGSEPQQRHQPIRYRRARQACPRDHAGRAPHAPAARVDREDPPVDRCRLWLARRCAAVRDGDDRGDRSRHDRAAEQHARDWAGGRVRRRGRPVLPRALQRRGRRERRRDRARAVPLDLVGVQERYRDGAVVPGRLRQRAVTAG